MDNILHDVDDFDGFLDLPNEFPDDICLDDLDALDFINDLDGNFIYDCDINALNQQPVINGSRSVSNNQHDSNTKSNNNSNNYYRNSLSDGMPMVFNNNPPPKEVTSSGNTRIRDLLSSDNGIRTNSSQGSYVSLDRYNGNNRQQNSNNGNHNARTHENRNIIPKHPIILPATSGSNGNMLRTPTLAATLIGLQPSSDDNIEIDSSSFGSGKVVRRNSHNAIEKRYRLSINDRIDELRQMLALGDNSKMNKSAVLRKAIERIVMLEHENNSLKRDNYNLRKSIANASSNESLNHTGSSPMSNHSDSGHSITNSPSSSSMNSTSIASSFLFNKNNDKQPCLIENSNKGLKRPLIYDTNVSSFKTEKLARLLLSSSDTYEDKYIDQKSEVLVDHKQSRKLHSSNMPSFLLCTMALFVVAFQPFDMVMNNYRSKVVTVTGRKILQKDPLSAGLGLTVLLAMSHWLLAFLLIWASTNNRYLLTKLVTFLLGKIRCMTCIAFHFNAVMNGDTLDSVETKLSMWRKDPSNFDLKLVDQLRLYNCECPRNAWRYSLELCAVLCGIVASYVPFNVIRSRPHRVAHKIATCLVTCAVEQSLIGNSFSGLESVWYKSVLLLAIRQADYGTQTSLSQLVMAQTCTIEFIRKYFVNKNLAAILFHSDNSLGDKRRCVFRCPEIRKIFAKTSLKRVKDKLSDSYLTIPITSDTVSCYYLVYVQEAMAVVIKKLLSREVDGSCDSVLRDIVNTSSIILTKDESRYIGTLCNLIVALKSGSRNQNLVDIADRLLLHYNHILNNNEVVEDGPRIGIQQLILSIKLLLSTMKLGIGKDNEVHDTNIGLISRITTTSITNVVTLLIFDSSLDSIISSLNGLSRASSRSTADIYYADLYAAHLRDYSDKHTAGFESMMVKFNILLQSLCQLNPIKSGLPTLKCKEERKFDTNSYRVMEFLSLDGLGLLGEYNNSKMRSH